MSRYEESSWVTCGNCMKRFIGIVTYLRHVCLNPLRLPDKILFENDWKKKDKMIKNFLKNRRLYDPTR